jgi:hypothetical protein
MILEAVKAGEQRREAIRMELKTLGTPRGKARGTSEILAELVEFGGGPTGFESVFSVRHAPC